MLFNAEIVEGAFSSHPPSRGAIDKPELQKIWLIDLFDRVGFLADGRRDGVYANRTAAILLKQRSHDLLIDLVQAEPVNLKKIKRRFRYGPIDVAGGSNLSIIAHPAEKAVGNTGRTSASAGNLRRPRMIDVDVQEPRRPFDDRRQLVHIVGIQPQHQTESPT